MSGLSPEGRDLLRGARDDFDATHAERQRVDRALGLRLGVSATAVGKPAASSGAAALSGGGAKAPAALLAASKWMAATLLVGATGAGGAWAVSRKNAAPATPHAVSAASEASPMPPPLVPRSLPTPTPSAPPLQPIVAEPASTLARDPAPRATASSAPPSAMVAAEVRLLRGAEEALHAGDANRALVLLDEHARTFPNGVLAEERSVELVTAFCKLGRVDDAQREAARFLRATPDSPLAVGLRRSCGAPRLAGAP